MEQLGDTFGLNIEFSNEQVKIMITILAGFTAVVAGIFMQSCDGFNWHYAL